MVFFLDSKQNVHDLSRASSDVLSAITLKAGPDGNRALGHFRTVLKVCYFLNAFTRRSKRRPSKAVSSGKKLTHVALL